MISEFLTVSYLVGHKALSLTTMDAKKSFKCYRLLLIKQLMLWIIISMRKRPYLSMEDASNRWEEDKNKNLIKKVFLITIRRY